MMFNLLVAFVLLVPLLALASPHNRLTVRAPATTIGINSASIPISGDPETASRYELNVTIAAASPSLGGIREPSMAWNLPVDILRSTNFNFSGNWLAVYFANISASITIDGRCTPDHTTGLCEMDEVDSSPMNMSRTLGDHTFVLKNPGPVIQVRVDASAGLQANLAEQKNFEPVSVFQKFEVTLQDAVILYSFDSLSHPIVAGFDKAMITTTPFQTSSQSQSTMPIQHKTVVDIAFRPTYDWSFANTSFAGVVAVEIPHITLTLTPITVGTETCDAITAESKSAFDNLTLVESSVTVGRAVVDENGETKRRADEVKKGQTKQCYSYDAAQEKLVVPRGGRKPKAEEISKSGAASPNRKPKGPNDRADSLSVASTLFAACVATFILAVSLV